MKKLLIAILCIAMFHIYAEDRHAKSSSEKTVEFYAGISLGWDHMVAKRTEQILTQGPPSLLLYFSDNKSQTANGLSGKIITGFFWNIPNTTFALSPEIYIGQGSAEMTKRESVYDPTPATKELQSTLRQRLSMGFVMRAGIYLTNCRNNFLHILIGIDQSKFENKFVLTNTDALGNTPPLFEKRSKFLRSSIIGIGFERKFNKFKLGIDIRYLNYSAWDKYSAKAAGTHDVISITLKPKIISTTLNICYLF